MMTITKSLRRAFAAVLCAVMLMTCALPSFAEDDFWEELPDCCEGLTPGDATGDGKIDFKDVSRIIRSCAGFNDEINIDNADVRNDDELSMRDVSLLIRYLAGWTNVRLGHLDSATETEATCISHGETSLFCELCYSLTYTYSPVSEHIFVETLDGFFMCTECYMYEDNITPVIQLRDWIIENENKETFIASHFEVSLLFDFDENYNYGKRISADFYGSGESYDYRDNIEVYMYHAPESATPTQIGLEESMDSLDRSCSIDLNPDMDELSVPEYVVLPDDIVYTVSLYEAMYMTDEWINDGNCSYSFYEYIFAVDSKGELYFIKALQGDDISSTMGMVIDNVDEIKEIVTLYAKECLQSLNSAIVESNAEFTLESLGYLIK